MAEVDDIDDSLTTFISLPDWRIPILRPGRPACLGGFSARGPGAGHGKRLNLGDNRRQLILRQACRRKRETLQKVFARLDRFGISKAKQIIGGCAKGADDLCQRGKIGLALIIDIICISALIQAA